MTGPVDLATLGDDVDWPDAYAAAVAGARLSPGSGRLAAIVEWLAGLRGVQHAAAPVHPRVLVVVGPGEQDLGDVVPGLADSVDIAVEHVAADADVLGALAAGAARGDDEAERGTDLLMIAAPDRGDAAAALTGVLTNTEPTALLPRGAEAVDTRTWIERAERLRDGRRRLSARRGEPVELLVELGDPVLAYLSGLIMRAAARRTPLLLDGTLPLAAALLCGDVQPRVERWWLAADTSTDPVHARILRDQNHEPVLALGVERADGLAAVLAVEVIRAATAISPAPVEEPDGEDTADG